MSRSKISPRSYEQPETPSIPTGGTNASLRNNNTSPPLSTSNPTSSGNASNANRSEKTRIPPSVRAGERKGKFVGLPVPTTGVSVSSRQQKKTQKNQDTIAESNMSDSGKVLVRKSGVLTASSENGTESVREVSIVDSSSDEVIGSMKNHSEPKLSLRENNTYTENPGVNSPAAIATDQGLPSGFAMLAAFISNAIDTQDWGRLDNLINTMREKKFRLDDPALKDSNVAQQMMHSAPLRILTANHDAGEVDHETQWILALGLLDLGCNWNVKDGQGNRVIDLLREQANPSLIEFVGEKFPNLKHLFSKA